MCVYKLVMNLLLECDFDEQCTTLNRCWFVELLVISVYKWMDMFCVLIR